MTPMSVISITADSDAIRLTLSGCPADFDPGCLRAFARPIWASSDVPARELPVQTLHDDVQLSVTVTRFFEEKDLIFFALNLRYSDNSGEIHQIPGVRYVTDLSNAAAHAYPYPRARTKKGLQIKVFSDEVCQTLGHAALNMNLPCILKSKPDEHTIVFRQEGREFYFDRPYLQAMDEKIRRLSANGVILTLILINRREWHGVWGDPNLDPILVHPTLHPEGVVGAFSVTKEESWAYYRACVSFLSERYLRPDRKYGQVSGLIIGNEVNSQWIYSNAGEMEQAEFLRQYLIALRTAFYAAKLVWSGVRVYVSLDHCWNLANADKPLRYYKGREFLENLHDSAKTDGDFDWSLAYHPFPEDLSRADFWNDRLASHDFDAGKITFKNLEQLPAFLRQERFLYSGKTRHIILSEQGLCAGNTSETEQIQADALAIAYRKAEALEAVEAFIYHSHIDEKGEGLFLGLLDERGRRRPIYDVFCRMDGEDGERLCREARIRQGISD